MIQIHDMPRQSGKTTIVKALMEYDQDLYCILPMKSHFRFYPQHLQGRLLSGNEDIYKQTMGNRVKKVILDEGFMYTQKRLAELYYRLGQMGIDVISFGTSQE